MIDLSKIAINPDQNIRLHYQKENKYLAMTQKNVLDNPILIQILLDSYFLENLASFVIFCYNNQKMNSI